MNTINALTSLRNRGCTVEASKIAKHCWVVTLPNGQVFEVWGSNLADFAETVKL